MKILLLNPPTRDDKKFIREGRCTQEHGFWATLWPPVSLATIAAVLEQNGHEVHVVDCPARGMCWDALLRDISRLQPAWVLWAAATPTISNDLSLAAAVKNLNPSIRTAAFGTHVTALDRECLERFQALDIIIRQEPEITARELFRSLADGADLHAVQGITWRDDAGSIHRNPDRPFIEDLDQLPYPAWHLVNVRDYQLPLKGRPFLIIAPQRGCPFRCSFCTCQTYYGSRLRRRSIDSVIAELVHDIATYHVRDFFVWAETFVIDREYVAGLCAAIIDRGLRIAWTCNSRVDTVDAELLRLMARAGCWMISFGIESAEQDVLDRACKGIRVEQARRAVALAAAAGIRTAGHFILGMPGDTARSLDKTIAFAQSLGLDIAQFYCCVPFPGSKLYNEALREGWIDGMDFNCFTQAGAVMRLPGLAPKEVNRAKLRAYRSFYGRPAAWRRIAAMLAGGGISGLWRAISHFMR